MNRPWMPLYIADYLRDTSHLRAIESGAYLHLIMAYWISGRLPNDDRQLATIAKLTDKQWKECKPTLAAFFGPDWSSHKRIDAELQRAAEVSAKRKQAAEQKWSKRDANASANAYTLHTSHITKKDKKDIRAVARATIPDPMFVLFWREYPKRKGANPKAPAEKLFSSAVKSGVPATQIIEALAAGVGYDREKIGTEYIPQAVKWLRDRRWEDAAVIDGAELAKRAENRAIAEAKGYRLIDGKWVKPGEAA
jgi:uncharacterized protein YdaU (DUF1376 family)